MKPILIYQGVLSAMFLLDSIGSGMKLVPIGFETLALLYLAAAGEGLFWSFALKRLWRFVKSRVK